MTGYSQLVEQTMHRHRAHLVRLLGKRPSHGIGVVDTSVLRSGTKHLMQKNHGQFRIYELWALERAMKTPLVDLFDDGFSVTDEARTEYETHHRRLKEKSDRPLQALKFWWNEGLPSRLAEVKSEHNEDREAARLELETFIAEGATICDLLKVRPTRAYWGNATKYYPRMHAAVTSITPPPVQNHSQDIASFASALVAGYTGPVTFFTGDKGLFASHKRFCDNEEALSDQYGFPTITHPVSMVYNNPNRPWVQRPSLQR